MPSRNEQGQRMPDYSEKKKKKIGRGCQDEGGEGGRWREQDQRGTDAKREGLRLAGRLR